MMSSDVISPLMNAVSANSVILTTVHSRVWTVSWEKLPAARHVGGAVDDHISNLIDEQRFPW